MATFSEHQQTNFDKYKPFPEFEAGPVNTCTYMRAYVSVRNALTLQEIETWLISRLPVCTVGEYLVGYVRTSFANIDVR